MAGHKHRDLRSQLATSDSCPACAPAPAGLHRYKLRLLFEVADMAPALPAVVNRHEARAYSNWLSAKQVGGLHWLPGCLGGCAVVCLGDWAGARCISVPCQQMDTSLRCAVCCAVLLPLQGLRGDAALRLLTEPEHARLRAVGARDAEGRCAEDPGEQGERPAGQQREPEHSGRQAGRRQCIMQPVPSQKVAPVAATHPLLESHQCPTPPLFPLPLSAVMAHSGAAFRASANLNLAFGSECAVDALPPTPAGFHDVAGNLWQWCEDHIASLPASQGVHPLYDDFTTPCYDGEHNVIVGGSFVSTGDLASVFARYHFRPHFFQQAGGSTAG